MTRTALFTATVLLLALLLPETVRGEVERLVIESREAFAGGHAFGAAGPYERLRGRVVYAVAPDDPRLAGITDLALALRDDRGRVVFGGDFLLLKPLRWRPERGVLLYDVTNRGGLVAPYSLLLADGGNDPRTVADAGDGLLLEHGWALLWTGWNWDVWPRDGRLQIDLPALPGVQGRVAAEIVTDWPADTLPLVWGTSRGYPPAQAADARMTVRQHQRDGRQRVPSDRWRMATTADGIVIVERAGGFRPGPIYEVVYTADRPRVLGLGLVAIRDAIAFFRHATADSAGTANPLAPGAPAALAFGVSQSGRALNHMLALGLNCDDAGRPVFDGALVHGAGAGKGEFNRRFGQPTRHPSPHEDHGYAVDLPPFGTAALAGAARKCGPPKLMFSNTASDYWLRAASLLHVDGDGGGDLPLDPAVRLYAFAGAQHLNWAEPRREPFRWCRNPVDHRFALRALILALATWVRGEASPPASSYPTLRAGELATHEAYRALVPSAVLPQLMPTRLSADVPAVLGAPFHTVVPMPDADGNDRGGLRLPLVAEPLGTFRGWNLKPGRDGTPDRLGRWEGAMLPFSPADIRARYPDEADYRARIAAAAARLASGGYLLARDIPAIAARAEGLYRRLVAEPRDADCAWLRE